MKTCRKSKIKELIEFDNNYSNTVIGTDEAGRGPVAGPVVASAVYFPEFNNDVIELLKYLDDSKKFGSKSSIREELAENIKKVSIYSISECTVEEIEKLNILQASLYAMEKSCNYVLDQINHNYNFKPDSFVTLVDGNFTVKNLNCKQYAIKKGDSVSASIAAASILSKVHRDNLMKDLALEYPAYGWENNKGYPTKIHIEAINNYGISKWHRKSFLGKIIYKQKKLF